MTQEIRIGKCLQCGCCGNYFDVWAGYKDQDQDAGFGICKKCQGWIDQRNEDHWKKLEAKVANSLNEKNRARFLSFELGVRRGFILKMMDEGVITWQISR